MAIAVIGLGPVGLAVSAAAVAEGEKVYGYDVDPIRRDYVKALLDGDIDTDEPAYNVLRHCRHLFSLRNVYDDALLSMNIKVICVNNNDILNVAEMLKGYVKSEDLIIFESTVNDLDVCLDAELTLEKVSKLTNFYVVFSAERVMEGKLLQNFYDMHRTIGTRSIAAYQKTKDFYRRLGVKGTMHLSTPEEASVAKIFENALRYVNIAAANELYDICQDNNLNYEKILELMNQRQVPVAMKRGIGIGGDCIPLAANMVRDLSKEAEMYPSIFDLAMERETIRATALSERILSEIAMRINKQRPMIEILGATYRPDGFDKRLSPALKIINLMQGYNRYTMNVYDPNWITGKNDRLYVIDKMPDKYSKYDCFVVLVGHKHFKDLFDYKVKYVIDLTGVVESVDADTSLIKF